MKSGSESESVVFVEPHLIIPKLFFRNSDHGMRVNREWVTSQLKKMKDMASSRDVSHHVVRGTSIDGSANPDLSVYVSCYYMQIILP